MKAKGVVLVTGANGFLGSALCQFLSNRGYIVRALVRVPESASALKKYAKGGIYRCDLPSMIDTGAFSGDVAAVIHCAFSTVMGTAGDDYETNVTGSKLLVRLTRECPPARFVFISSISAHDQAESTYGRTKLAVEKALDPEADLIIKPGLIVGPGGLFLRMRESLRRLPIVPLFYGGNQEIQLISILDLCEAIERCLTQELSGRYIVAASPPYPIREFYSELASLDDRKCRFVRLPGAPVLAVLRLTERLGLHLPISSENLLGLKCMKSADPVADMARLNLLPVRKLKEMAS